MVLSFGAAVSYAGEARRNERLEMEGGTFSFRRLAGTLSTDFIDRRDGHCVVCLCHFASGGAARHGAKLASISDGAIPKM